MHRNVFDSEWGAGKYATSRPGVHAKIVERIRESLSIPGSVELAVDVGCGTGMSTRTLGRIARRVIGVDPSQFMLAEAERAGGGACYIRGSAEALPLPGGCADLVTMSQVYHWCETEKLLSEAARILVPGGWLIVYDSYFSPTEGGLAGLLQWMNTELWRGYPVPPRVALPDPANFFHPAFELVRVEVVEQSIPMDGDRFTAFVLTQSRTLAAVDWGGANLGGLERTLRERVSALFGAEEVPIPFVGPVCFLRRN